MKKEKKLEDLESSIEIEENSSFDEEGEEIVDISEDEIIKEFNEITQEQKEQIYNFRKNELGDLISSNRFIGKVSKNLLTREQETALFYRLSKSKDPIEKETIRKFIIEKNIGLVVSIANKIKKSNGGQNVRFEDIVQEGIIGLYKSMSKFEFKRDFKLSTYATWWIRQKMQEFVADNMFTVRITCHRRNELGIINRFKEEFIKENFREPTREEIQEYTGWPDSRMNDLFKLMGGVRSLDDPLNGEDGKTTVGDATQSDEDIHGNFEMKEIMKIINDSLVKLTPKEKKIFMMSQGIQDGMIIREGMRFDEIEDVTGIERSEIRKCFKKARERLSEELIKKGITYENRMEEEYE